MDANIAIISGLLALIGIALTAYAAEIKDIKNQLKDVKRENFALQLWARELVDYAYTYRKPQSPPLPEPPDYIGK